MPKITLLKIGGAKLKDDAFLESLARYTKEQTAAQNRVVIVHGGGPQIEALHTQLDVPYKKIDGLRVTTAKSMPLVTQILCGSANKGLVSHLQKSGLPAFGLSGVDGGLMRSPLLGEGTYGRVGNAPDVNAKALETLLAANFLPVVAPVCLGPDNLPVNVNADSAALAIAKCLQADCLEFVSDVEGVKTPDGIVSRLNEKMIEELIKSSVVVGGMIPKLRAAALAVKEGVGSVRIGSLIGMMKATATEIIATPSNQT